MTTDQKVVGSIPAGRVTKSLDYSRLFFVFSQLNNIL